MQIFRTKVKIYQESIRAIRSYSERLLYGVFYAHSETRVNGQGLTLHGITFSTFLIFLTLRWSG